MNSSPTVFPTSIPADDVVMTLISATVLNPSDAALWAALSDRVLELRCGLDNLAAELRDPTRAHALVTNAAKVAFRTRSPLSLVLLTVTHLARSVPGLGSVPAYETRLHGWQHLLGGNQASRSDPPASGTVFYGVTMGPDALQEGA